MSEDDNLKLRTPSESVGWLNSVGPLHVSPDINAPVDNLKIKEFTFTLEELKAIKRITYNQYIHYDDLEATAVATKIYKLIDEAEEKSNAKG